MSDQLTPECTIAEDGKSFTTTCPHCGKENILINDTVYVDDEGEYYICTGCPEVVYGVFPILN